MDCQGDLGIEKGAYKKQIIERNIGNQLGFDSN